MLNHTLPRTIVFSICATLFSGHLLYSQTTNNHTLESDSLALVDFYNALNGPNWPSIGDGWLTDDINNWDGVDIRNGRVSALEMTSANGAASDLQGDVPSSFGDLDSLKVLTLPRNGIRSLPDEFSKLAALEEFYFHSTAFSGGFPQGFGNLKNLKTLEIFGILNENNVDDFRSFVLDLESLEALRIVEARVSSSIPSEIFQITQLKRLWIWDGDWTGSIPDEIGQMVNLEWLDFSRNSLTGTLPESIGQLNDLVQLAIGENGIDGSLPSTLSNLSKLKVIFIEGTQMSGDLDSQLGPLLVGPWKDLNSIYIVGNQFTGQVPSALQNTNNLSFISLRDNQLEGSINVDFTLLSDLDLSSQCHFEGNSSSLCIADSSENRSIDSSGFCGVALCSTSVNNTAETPESLDFHVEVFPNPASDRLNLSTDRDHLIEHIKVFDLLGRMKMESHGNGLNELDISKLTSGQYFLHIADKSGSIVVKSVIVSD